MQAALAGVGTYPIHPELSKEGFVILMDILAMMSETTPYSAQAGLAVYEAWLNILKAEPGLARQVQSCKKIFLDSMNTHIHSQQQIPHPQQQKM